VTALFGQIRPEVWVSDMLRSQRGHGGLWQVCLAHLLRDAKYAIECGDTAFSAPLRRLLLRAIAIGRRRETLKDATPKQYLHDLDRRLDRIMATVPIGEPGRKLRKRMLANRGHLFVFMTNRDVPYTNNVSERHLRPSVIFRKVTNGFRCEWGAETYAAFRSVVSTAKANRAPVLEIVRFVLSAKRPVEVSRRGRVSNYVNSLVFVQNHCVEVQAAENVQDLRVRKIDQQIYRDLVRENLRLHFLWEIAKIGSSVLLLCRLLTWKPSLMKNRIVRRRCCPSTTSRMEVFVDTLIFWRMNISGMGFLRRIMSIR